MKYIQLYMKVMRLLMKYLMIILILAAFSFRSNAQDQSKQDNVSEPAWVKMMEDKNVNYYEAIKVYEAYWKNHKKPLGEEDELAGGKEDLKEMQREAKKEQKKDLKRKFTEEDLKKANEEQRLRYQVKRFEHWMREVKPFVQEDGRVLSDEERIAIWKKQQEEIKKQQK